MEIYKCLVVIHEKNNNPAFADMPAPFGSDSAAESGSTYSTIVSCSMSPIFSWCSLLAVTDLSSSLRYRAKTNPVVEIESMTLTKISRAHKDLERSEVQDSEITEPQRFYASH